MHLFFILFLFYYFFISFFFSFFTEYLCSYNCPATGLQNGEEASPSIILAGQALLVKVLITLEPCGAFGSNFVYLCIITLSSHCYAKW